MNANAKKVLSDVPAGLFLCLLVFRVFFRWLDEGCELAVFVVVDGGVDGVAFVVVELCGDGDEGVLFVDAHAGEDAFEFFVGDDDAVFESFEDAVVFAV